MLASVATAALALGGLVATAMPASAHTPKVSADCQNLTVDLRAYADGSQYSWWYGKKRGGHHGSEDKVNTVTVTVNGEVEIEEAFGKSFRRTLELDPTQSNEWTVDVDAWDNDVYDFDEAGTTEPCVAPSPQPEPENEIQTAFYVYPKLRAHEPAAWHNSGKQTRIAVRDGAEFWETLPEEYPGEYFDVADLPADVCESWGVQQDIVGIHQGFDWADYVHITYPHGPLFQDLIAHRHTDLSEFLPECGDQPKEKVTLPAPSSVEQCDAEDSVVLPESEHATYTEKWNDDRTEVTVTATPHEGVELTEDSETSWTFTFTHEPCEVELEPVVVTPDLPTVEDLCGTENDDVRLPANTDEVTYETTADGIVATPAEGFAFDEKLPAEYTAQDDGTAIYTLPEGSFTDEPCELVPGDTGAVCDAETPYLVYEVSLPEGSEAAGENPLTVTFLNPDGEDHVTTDLPLEGRLLWPGASAEEPLQWPGWEQLEDGSYVETDDNYAWTRDGVQVQFEVNPDYSMVVNYPPASEECADAPSDLREAPAQTVVDVPVDAEEVAAQEDELAVTGATIGVAAAVALLLVGGGVALFVVRRRLQQS